MPVLSYADRAKQRPTKQYPPPLQTATTSSSSSQPTTSTPSSASFQTATTSASVSAPPPFPAPAVSPVGPIVTPVSVPQPAKAPVVNVWQVRAARRAAPPPPPPVPVPAPVAVEDDPFVVRPRPPVATVDPWPTVSRGVYSVTFAFGSADMWMPLHAWTILFGLHSCSIGDEALLCVASASPIDREVLHSAVTPVATSPLLLLLGLIFARPWSRSFCQDDPLHFFAVISCLVLVERARGTSFIARMCSGRPSVDRPAMIYSSPSPGLVGERTRVDSLSLCLASMPFISVFPSPQRV
ncbi:hypothetical protein C8R45DRAFT_269029 [Mycena sanguinolenta]|nr:hypothetical protein C8R45DRAFT_269029 [Mycena sanguinolenta]